MTETQQVVWFAIAAGAGILLGVAGSLWIDVLVRRSRVLVFGWLDREEPVRARLSVYVKNDTAAPVKITEVGTIAVSGQRQPATAGEAHRHTFAQPLPVVIDAGDVVVVCVLAIDGSDTIESLAGCYAVRTGGRMVKGPVFRQDRASG